jgi:hypothetical protein
MSEETGTFSTLGNGLTSSRRFGKVGIRDTYESLGWVGSTYGVCCEREEISSVGDEARIVLELLGSLGDEATGASGRLQVCRLALGYLVALHHARYRRGGADLNPIGTPNGGCDGG